MAELASAARRKYRLSDLSLGQLVGVHPKLVAMVRQAIRLTEQDFRVTDGIRTPAKQRRLVAAGTSWTLRSKHLVQPDGFGHAVDLVPWVAGELNWSWQHCYKVAAAMSLAAYTQGVEIRWGGVWDLPMSANWRSAKDLQHAVEGYVGRRRQAGGRAAIDGVHFELF